MGQSMVSEVQTSRLNLLAQAEMVLCLKSLTLGGAEQSYVHKPMEALCSRSGRGSPRTPERYDSLQKIGVVRDVSFLRGSAIRCGVVKDAAVSALD